MAMGHAARAAAVCWKQFPSAGQVFVMSLSPILLVLISGLLLKISNRFTSVSVVIQNAGEEG